MQVCNWRFEFQKEKISIKTSSNDEIGYLEYDKPDEFENCVRIQNMVILPQYRRNGFGTQLIDCLKRKCVEQFFRCDIEVYIFPIANGVTTDDLIRFYKHNGFKVRFDNLKEPQGIFRF